MDNIFNGSSDLPAESEELFGEDQCAFGYLDNIFNGSSDLPAEFEELFGKDQCAFGYSAAMGSLDVPPNTQVYCNHASDCSMYILIH